jgi:four helix bundle protein
MDAMHYKDLRVWQKSMEVVKVVYNVTEKFPKNEMYGLANQMRRAAVSIPSNIAEGFRRNYKKEFGRSLRIALGSCGELETQLIIAHERKYFDTELHKVLEDSLDHIGRMITKLTNSLDNER